MSKRMTAWDRLEQKLAAKCRTANEYHSNHTWHLDRKGYNNDMRTLRAAVRALLREAAGAADYELDVLRDEDSSLSQRVRDAIMEVAKPRKRGGQC